jgi:hypothetical protein
MNFELGFYKYYYENSLNIGFFHGKELIDGKELGPYKILSFRKRIGRNRFI